jgi:hypothetical protein
MVALRGFQRVSVEALVLAYLMERGRRGATVEELRMLVDAASRMGLLASSGDPLQEMIDYLAYLKRNHTIEVDGDRVFLNAARISPMLRRILEKVRASVLSRLEAALAAMEPGQPSTLPAPPLAPRRSLPGQ